MNNTLLEFILHNAQKFEWSIQGMGFLRLYLPNNSRLHIWDSRYRVPGVSMIHDHLQWGLESTILAGELTNIRYLVAPNQDACGYVYSTLKPGYGCYFKHTPKPIHLLQINPEHYFPGDVYFQRPSEIHQTDARDGTITLMKKSPTDDGDSARVFWRAIDEWVSAEPRIAKPHEVEDITQNALRRWLLK